MPSVHHRYTTVDGHRLFYREAGPSDAPVIVLLHGFPTSSYMFRQLVPILADRYRVIAPDMLGFGLSDAPAADEFDYTFDAWRNSLPDCCETSVSIGMPSMSRTMARRSDGALRWRTRPRSPLW